ncbi:ThuA domain-containing protein [Nocardioides hwasunensis]|uniref:ThuA domain-containing protein n=2 Tax=Nocardioides hwasunensis TaxID=397258 RepID=A0ABR8MIP8_9ACTN|nr:ThuA domain-containing protein [Nocardioides hwasunensis]
MAVALPLAAAGTAQAAGPAPATAAAAAAPGSVPDGTFNLLLFYKPNFHASHVQGRQAIRELATELATEYGQVINIQETDDPSAFTAANLATKDAVAFMQTGGVLFNEAQRTALEAYIRGGGGYFGQHYAGWSVGQSEHDVNPFYLRLVGAMSEGHPENPAVRPGRVVNAATSHPLTTGLPAEITRSDEWYDWVVNPAPNVKTLLSIDESSVQSLGHNGTTHPVTWCQTIDSGRSWYSGLGHEGSAYSEPFIRTMMKNGLAYSAGFLEADCAPPVKDQQGSWSGVTPWPLMPINAALTSDGKVQSFGSVASCTPNDPYAWSGNNCVTQGGQMEIDVWDPQVPRTIANVVSGVIPNVTYTDLFCSMQVQMPHRRATMTVGGDDGLGGNAPNESAIGVTSYTTNSGLRNEAPMNFPRWYPTGTTMPDGSIVVQGGALEGGPGGPGVITPERYTPHQGSSWKLLTGAASAQAYGEPNGAVDTENRWWYPRAFVNPTNGKLFTITGTQMFELDPDADNGNGAIAMRGGLGSGTVGNQGNLGNPVGATSTATMYRPGKILQVGGGAWSNGGGGDGARAGFTVDINGANPTLAATDPMTYARHWPTSTVMPDGNVIVTGGSRANNGNGGYVTNAEIWDPTKPSGQQWTEVKVPHERARLYHSIALLLPDGRIMIGGGGAPGPRNYTDVEYYSPAYLFDGNQPAVRPVVTNAPKKVGYNGSFTMSTASNVSRVTLVRNGSVTHGFNNDQNFQDLTFSKNGNTLTVNSPSNANFAPPGSYMVFVWDANGTPSVANIVQIDPQVKMDSAAPKVVDQFEYPRLPSGWQSGTYPNTADVAAGSGRMAPWEIASAVQLVRAQTPGLRGLGQTGYVLSVGANGDLSRPVQGLDVGQEYRLSIRYARDSRAAGTAPGTANLSIGTLDAALSAGAETSSTGAFGTYVGTFTATSRRMPLSIKGGGAAANLVLDNLVIVPTRAGASEPAVHYKLDEGTGTKAANSGTDVTVGAADLVGTTGWSPTGKVGGALDMKGGSNANTVDLPDNLLQNEADFTTAFWVRPDTKGNWINLFHIGDGLGDAGSFFQIQMQTQAAGNTGLAATFKKKGDALQERVYATNPTRDVTANQWNHVVFTRQGTTGTLYLNGAQVATRNNLTLTMTDVGPTTNNWLGRNGYNDPSFDGLMDDVRLYTTSLSAADVAGLYADGNQLDTTTTVSVSPASPSPFNTPITVSATVKDSANANVSGTAELWVNGSREGAQATVTDGAVSFPALTLPPRQHELEVRFLAGTGFRDSSAKVTHTVARPPVGEGIPVHYKFDEGSGTTAANSGSDPAIGNATLQGNAGWVASAKYGAGVNLPGAGHVNLPNDVTFGMDEQVTVSTWIRPTNLPNWTTHVQIGKSTANFLLLQSRMENGTRGFGVTLRKNEGVQYRTMLPGNADLPLGQWTHVAVTLGRTPNGTGTTVKIYLNGALQATSNDVPVTIGEIAQGGTAANFLGNGSWNDPRPTEQQDDFRIYGYELSAADVLAIYNGTSNAAPVGVADAYTTAEGVALSVPAPGVLANDTDAEGDTLTAGDVTQPGNGEVALAANGSFTYTPVTGFSGTDTFTYRANDGTSKSAPTTVTITVEKAAAEPNAEPVAVDDAFTTVSGEPLTLAAPGVLGNDTDADGDQLTATATSQPVNGSVVLRADGSFTYTPDAGFVGKDTFTYTASDGTDTSAPATVTITVKPTGGGGGGGGTGGGNGETGPLNSAVAGASASFTYGKAGSLVVSVAPAAATGRVELVSGTDLVAAGTLAAGQARLDLAAQGLVPGTHRLTLRYVGDGAHKASSSVVEVVVDKVVPRMSVKAPNKVKKGKRATVRAVLRAPDGVRVTGDVTFKIKGGKKIAGTLKDGRVFVQLPKAKGKRIRLVVTYQGSATVESTREQLTIRVRRR